MKVSVKNLRKNFRSSDGDVEALRGVSFEIEEGCFYTLLGPSGCGKSTTLRCIAGLENPTAGEIVLGDQVVASNKRIVPANERPIGMVFQSYAIWPHMTVFNNVAFPLKQRKSFIPKAERSERVMETLKLVQMETYADRPAPFLSGGQQQRVALARALVSRPEVLLLDEPLSNLDAKLRDELRMEIKELTRRLGITSVYVTHDQLEALTMSDRIAVMNEGRILQEGSPNHIYLRPKHRFVAEFVGVVNFLEGRVKQMHGQNLAEIETDAGNFLCSVDSDINANHDVIISVRPESLRIDSSPSENSINHFEAKIVRTTFLGESLDCQLSANGQALRAKLDPTVEAKVGAQLSLSFTPQACTVFRS